MECDRCKSERIINVNGNISNICDHYKGNVHYDKVPCNIGIGGDDYITINYCLQCGKIYGDFPVKDPEFDKHE